MVGNYLQSNCLPTVLFIILYRRNDYTLVFESRQAKRNLLGLKTENRF